MGGRRTAAIIALAFTTACGLFRSSEELEIRQLLQALSTEINSRPGDGVGSITRAAQIGAFFSEDVRIELGAGSEPIVGRDTVIGMASRLESRTSKYTLTLEGITVSLSPDAPAADVSLTAEFVRQSVSPGESSLDAREFELALRREDGQWYITRVTAIETLRK